MDEDHESHTAHRGIGTMLAVIAILGTFAFGIVAFNSLLPTENTKGTIAVAPQESEAANAVEKELLKTRAERIEIFKEETKKLLPILESRGITEINFDKIVVGETNGRVTMIAPTTLSGGVRPEFNDQASGRASLELYFKKIFENHEPFGVILDVVENADGSYSATLSTIQLINDPHGGYLIVYITPEGKQFVAKLIADDESYAFSFDGEKIRTKVEKSVQDRCCKGPYRPFAQEEPTPSPTPQPPAPEPPLQPSPFIGPFAGAPTLQEFMRGRGRLFPPNPNQPPNPFQPIGSPWESDENPPFVLFSINNEGGGTIRIAGFRIW